MTPWWRKTQAPEEPSSSALPVTTSDWQKTLNEFQASAERLDVAAAKLPSIIDDAEFVAFVRKTNAENISAMSHPDWATAVRDEIAIRTLLKPISK